MKYYIIAGEASGDLHGANLMREIKKNDHKAEFRIWGGDLMKAQGADLVKHYQELAFMGVQAVLMNLGKIKQNFKTCKEDLLHYRPDVLILIDYPGFNLRVARIAHENGLKVYYYISPKLWASRPKRAEAIKAYVDKMFCIFPFEIDFYNKLGYEVTYIGNPLVDEIEKNCEKEVDRKEFIAKNKLSGKPIIALLPGSRKQEHRYILPTMLSLVEHYPDFEFVVAGAPSFKAEYYHHYLENKALNIVFDQTYDLLRLAHTAVVASGTATLETGLLRVPQVVCYKFEGGAIVYNLVKALFLKVKYVSLVNLILGREAVRELIQQYFTPASLKQEVDLLLYNERYRNKMLDCYEELHRLVGKSGASSRAAELIVGSLREK